MNASAISKKRCIKCDKGGGIFTCDGCQQSYCGKHVNEHRQELGVELDNIMQEHDSLQHEIIRLSLDHSSLEKIDQWEKDSIAEIQATAEKTRANLQAILVQSKDRLLKICRDTAINICSSREADDFSENDLIQWKEQLKEVQLETKSSSLVKFIQDRRSVIHLIEIASDESKNDESLNNEKKLFISLNTSKFTNKEKFIGGLGPAILENGGLLVKHTGPTGNYAYIFGDVRYSYGDHTIRLKIENCHLPYRIFLGCTSFQRGFTPISFLSPDIMGWFELNQVYENGRCRSNSRKYNYNSFMMKTNDILHITFDCDQKQIKLFNERLNTTSKLLVNTNKLPYPWRLLLALVDEKDCVRILTDI
jgi:hypothetical protein